MVACGAEASDKGGGDAAGGGRGGTDAGSTDAAVGADWSVALVILGPGCLGSQLPVDANGAVVCRLFEAVPSADAAPACSAPGRAQPDDALAQVVRGALAQRGACDAGRLCHDIA